MMTSSSPVMRQSQLVSTDSKKLPLRGAALRCDARGGVARVVFEQRFANPHAEPLHVTYTFALPADAAVSGFRFRIGDKIVEGEIDKMQLARERFEEAMLAGQTAAILDQERSSLFTQEIGNIPPGAEVVCEIVLDQKLRYLDGDSGAWEWRFPLAAAPRYLGVAGRVDDSGKIALDVADSSTARASLAMDVGDALVANRSPESPTHPLSCIGNANGFHVELGSGNAAPLDRDVVVRWPVATGKIGISCAVAGPRETRFVDAHALLTVVPPAKSARAASVSRDVTFLLDTSGSMSGSPIDQAKRVVLAMLDGLSATDRFEAIEFSTRPRRFESDLLFATPANKSAATQWVRSLQASGGTEMREGILEALRPTRERRRNGATTQVVLVTDGLIGFEQEIIGSILALLPGDARLHTVGVGSSVNRSLTAPAARAGRGIEVVIGLGEDPEQAATRLRLRSDAPIVVDVEATGAALLQVSPVKLPDLFAGAPVLISARVRAEGGEVVLRGKCAEGSWEERVQVPPSASGTGSDGIVTLFGREAVEDLEMQIAGGAEARTSDATIESLGLAYRISTRLTSWIAIDKSQSVDPRDPTRRVTMPQSLPHGMSAEGLGLRRGAPPMSMRMQALGSAQLYGGAPSPAMAMPAAAPPRSFSRAERTDKPTTAGAPMPAQKSGLLGRIKDAFFDADSSEPERRDSVIGRVVMRKSGEVVIAFTATDDLVWIPNRVTIDIDGNGSAPATIDTSRTTRSGSISAGSTIRIALQFAPSFGAAKINSIEVRLANGVIVIEIEG